MEDTSQAEERGSEPVEKAGQGSPETGEGTQDNPVYFSNSAITTFQECEKKYEWGYVQLLSPKRKGAPLTFGSALHEGIRNLYRGKKEANTKLVADYIPQQGEQLRTQAKLEAVLRTYEEERFPPIWKVLAVEEPIILTDDNQIPFVVVPDLVVEWRNGEIYVIEHKHSTRLTNNFFDKFQRDTQIDAEMLAVKSKYGRCDGVYINAIIIRKGGPSSKLAEVEILTDLVTRSEEALEKSKKHISQIVRRIIETDDFLENRKACFNYNSRCPYLGLCTGTITEIESLFEKRQRSLELLTKQEEEE